MSDGLRWALCRGSSTILKLDGKFLDLCQGEYAPMTPMYFTTEVKDGVPKITLRIKSHLSKLRNTLGISRCPWSKCQIIRLLDDRLRSGIQVEGTPVTITCAKLLRSHPEDTVLAIANEHRRFTRTKQHQASLAVIRENLCSLVTDIHLAILELHKEKLLRDRLEQKNLKLMDRMQKLMMVVETMRKENVTLERNLVAKEQHCETKEMQLRQVTHKAKQLQKLAKGKVAGQKGGKSSGATVLELESPQQGLPPLDRSQRSIDSSGGRRSGMSTPRTPRAPPSPYGSR